MKSRNEKMQMHRLKLLVSLMSLSYALSGCATSRPQVGAVVEAPKITLPPVSTLVKEVEPKPTGYFQKKTLEALGK